MKAFIQTLKNIWSIKELREKLIFTFALILVYRFGTHVPLPSINMVEVDNILDIYKNNGGNQQATGLLGLLSSFTGGAFSKASIFALGIMPYISASIVVQLMGLAIPYIQKLQKEGESGRKTVNQITRWLTIIICLIQAPAYLTSITQVFLPYEQFRSAYLVDPHSVMLFWVPSIIILISGTIFAMWMGEKITDKGIGNGISILIMVGILAGFPTAFVKEVGIQMGDTGKGLIMILVEVLVWLFVIILCIMLTVAVRKVPVQYVSRTKSGSLRSITNAARQYIPLKVNAAGVMPIIFAQALMFIPGLIVKSDTTNNTFWAGFSQVFSWQYNTLFAILIIVFTFFYTAITIPVNQMADDLKRNGGLIPRVKPGQETADYLDDVLSKITLPGAIYLALIAILPAIVKIIGLTATDSFALFFGGTSLLIMVGVLLDTVQQINTYLLNHHYDGLMQSRLSRNPH
ncbi:preprotein translocase subunit SecY [Apibacter adventoris]|uniref:Protein translocase subunit SecY n=1 Tax=Apibacter adventoris TaxID=1679466 RepID=A0A2S8AG40_9FLAO|nr:preprotein translocase subunit SecY [Apibacter adventoris]PQL93916.1 preprotein translocase subunit SecY [Apibacter adventoris]PQL95345.1 preprotein translocase subunit SecY [Apibacter adventoris]